MDYFQMTAPCGLDCFNCHFFLAREDQKAIETKDTKNDFKFSWLYKDKGGTQHDNKIAIHIERSLVHESG